jgi:hypothetical protein
MTVKRCREPSVSTALSARPGSKAQRGRGSNERIPITVFLNGSAIAPRNSVLNLLRVRKPDQNRWC